MVALLSAAIAPVFALLAFFYLKDEYELEPIYAILRTFIYGTLIVFPIMFIQYAFIEEEVAQTPIMRSYLLFGLLEEFFKWFIFMFTTYKYSKFNTVYDGIVYGVSISLGFATVENILYLLANGIEVAFSRAVFPVSSHALFGVIMGYYFGRAKCNSQNESFHISISLFLPVFFHGTYDFILETITHYWVMLLVPFMVILWMYSLRKVKLANEYAKQDYGSIEKMS
ncbi:membrane proteinase PrsW, regulator of anti-sigma factor RsiW [Gracilibacillus halophilus YIM-C55.5]|uniref:Protease PrsW n=1 Tax=Gracilibacillus halophilus YIM-C55.5 TaxID=1308866 RepID=N4WDM4_9BACI|nr:glutamic-type intramembrane protease PrsW [Gracilibacillus halophilus]ENH97359.1 membrane proteinase PrsW, regulator of anti-sigma factor RsiW [Gracilibacillus halophilus YIM-C55.5]